MRRVLLFVIAAWIVSAAPVVAAPLHASTYYDATLSRIDSDVYRDQYTRNYVLTRFCYHFANFEHAILAYNNGYPQEVLWDGGDRCDLVGVYRSNATVTRVESNVYEDSNGGYWITRYCYAYAYSEQVLVINNQIIFQYEACDLR